MDFLHDKLFLYKLQYNIDSNVNYILMVVFVLLTYFELKFLQKDF